MRLKRRAQMRRVKMAEAYRIVIEPLSEEDGGGFAAFVPDLPGCMADGETRSDAVANAEGAIESWIAAAEAHGRPVPHPSRVYA